MKRIKIIANPSSGREEAIDIVKKLIVPFALKGTSVLLNFTQTAEDAKRFAMTDDGEEAIISVGGDGTVNEVVSGLYEKKRRVPLAIYPAGTVNDFAESMGIPKDPYDFYAMVVYGKNRAIDIGLCGERAFINVCAMGMFTEIGYSASDAVKSSIGRLAYYVEGLRAFRFSDLSRESFHLRVETDEEVLETEALIAMVSNSSSIGGFSKISPTADVEDGLLELIIIEKMSISKIIELFTSIGLGKHTNHDHFIYRKVKSATLSADKSMHMDIDGEKGPLLPQKIEVIPGAIQLLTK